MPIKRRQRVEEGSDKNGREHEGGPTKEKAESCSANSGTKSKRKMRKDGKGESIK
jgi:hypothetical protein